MDSGLRHAGMTVGVDSGVSAKGACPPLEGISHWLTHSGMTYRVKFMCILSDAYLGAIYSAICALMWATAVIFFKKSGEKVSPTALNFFKNSIALVLFIFTLFAIKTPFMPVDATFKDYILLSLSGILGLGLADTLFFASLNKIGAGLTAIVDCTYSPLIFLCSFIFLNEPVGLSIFLAMFLMVAAILVGTWQKDTRKEKSLNRRDLIIGVLLGILSMFLIGLAVVIIKPLLNKFHPASVMTVRIVAALIFVMIQVSITGKVKPIIQVFKPSAVWKYTIPSGVIGAYFSMLFWILGLKYTLTVTASVISQSSALLIMAFAVFFLKESFSLRKGIALLLGLVAGVIAVLEPF